MVVYSSEFHIKMSLDFIFFPFSFYSRVLISSVCFSLKHEPVLLSFIISMLFVVKLFFHYYLQMPTTIEELEAAIQDNISQANSIFFINQNILQEYEHRQQQVLFFHLLHLYSLVTWYDSSLRTNNHLQIEAVTRKLEADKKELRRCLAEIDALKVRSFISSFPKQCETICNYPWIIIQDIISF